MISCICIVNTRPSAFSQLVGGLAPIFYFGRKNSSILRLGKTSYDGRAILRACINGSSEFMSNISMNVVGMLYNVQLFAYAGENGIAAYGVMMYVGMIFSAAFMGYSIGTAPVVGYNYGAQNHKELKGLLKKSLIMIGVFEVTMVIAAEVLSVPLAGLFIGYDQKLMEMTVFGSRIFSLAFVFMGFAIFSSVFYRIERWFNLCIDFFFAYPCFLGGSSYFASFDFGH